MGYGIGFYDILQMLQRFSLRHDHDASITGRGAGYGLSQRNMEKRRTESHPQLYAETIFRLGSYPHLQSLNLRSDDLKPWLVLLGIARALGWLLAFYLADHSV